MGRRRTDGRSSPLHALPRALLVTAAGSACLLLVLAAGYVVAAAAVRVAPLSLAVIAALLLTALFAPVSAALVRLRLPRSLAALGTVLTLLGTVVLAAVFIWNRAAPQLTDVRAAVTDGLRRTRNYLVEGPLALRGEQVDRIGDALTGQLQATVPSVLGGAISALHGLAAVLLSLVLLFFLLKDGSLMWGWVLRLVPARHRVRIDRAGHAGWYTLGRYVRGTVAVAVVDSFGIGLALVLIRVPLVVPLVLLTFLGGFVPIVGATVAGAAAVLVALVFGGVTDALLVLAAVIAVQQIESNLLLPLIMGQALHLHPAVILLAVSAGTLLAGIAGAVIAVPALAVSYRIVAALVEGEHRPDDGGHDGGHGGGQDGGHDGGHGGGQDGGHDGGADGPVPTTSGG